MDEDFLREVAAQLRKPSGELGNEVVGNMNLRNRAMNIAAIDALSLHDEEVILEIGMANGAFVPEILNRANGLKYIGVDYSPDMVEMASNQNKMFVQNGVVEFLSAEVSNLKVPSKSVDKIFTVNTIYFWEDSDLALDEIKRALKDGGLFITAFRPQGCLQKYPPAKFNFKYFTISDVEQLFTEHGFEVVSTRNETEPEIEILEKMIIPEYAVVVGKKSR